MTQSSIAFAKLELWLRKNTAKHDPSFYLRHLHAMTSVA